MWLTGRSLQGIDATISPAPPGQVSAGSVPSRGCVGQSHAGPNTGMGGWDTQGHVCPTHVSVAPSDGRCCERQPGSGGPAEPWWGVTTHLPAVPSPSCLGCKPQAAHPGPRSCPRRWDPKQSPCPGHHSCSPCSPQLVFIEVVDVQGLPPFAEDLLLLFPLCLLLPTLFL